MLRPTAQSVLRPTAQAFGLAFVSRGMRNKATPSAGKAKADAQRAAAAERFAKLLRVALKNDDESQVQSLIKEAYKANVSKLVVERAVERSRNRGTLEEVMYEGTLPSGVLCLIEALTDNKKKTAPEVRHALKEGGGELATSGSATWAFQRRAVLDFEPLDEAARDALVEEVMSQDTVEDVDDVAAYDDGEGSSTTAAVPGVRVWTTPAHLGALRSALAPHADVLVNEQMLYVPLNVVELSEVDPAAAASVEETVAALKALDDVEEVWTNAVP